MSADRRPHRVLHLIPSDAIGGLETAAHSLPAGLDGDNAILDDPGKAGAMAQAAVGAWVGVPLYRDDVLRHARELLTGPDPVGKQSLVRPGVHLD